MDSIMNLIFIKRNYKIFITILAASINLFCTLFTLLPPYLLKRPNFYILENNPNSNLNLVPLFGNQSVPFKKEYCDSSKYILKKDPINSLHNWSYDYDIYCNKYDDIYELCLTVAVFLGAIIGNIVLGPLPDKYGREKMIKILLLWELFLQINLLFNFGIIHLIITLFFIGINLYTYSMVIILSEEYIINDKGLVFGIVNAIYPLGGILVGILFITVNNWKFIFIISIISLIILIFYSHKYLYESPRWLHSTGQKEKCLEILYQISKFNNMEEEWILFKQNNQQIISSIGTIKESGQDQIQSQQKELGIRYILSLKSQRKNFICTIMACFSASYCFFGIVLYLDEMKGNFYLNSIFTFFGELVAEIISGKLADIFGRKKIILYTVIFGTIFFSFYYILPENFSGLFLMVSMMGYSGYFLVIYILANEIFPTQIRATVISFCCLTERIPPIFVKMLGLLLNTTLIDFSFIIMGIFSIYLVFTYFTETLNQKPKDFVEEEEDKQKEKIKEEDNLKSKFLNQYNNL